MGQTALRSEIPASRRMKVFLSRIILDRLQNTVNILVEDNRLCALYFQSGEDDDPSPDPNLLESVDCNQKEDVAVAVRDTLERVKANGVQAAYHSRLEELVTSHIDTILAGLSSGERAALPPLQLTPNAKPVKVKLRSCSQEVCNFLNDFFSTQRAKGVIYVNSNTAWAAVPLLVQEPGTTKFLYTLRKKASLCRCRCFRPVLAGSIAHIPKEGTGQHYSKLRHASLAFLSRTVNDTKALRSILEKEAFAISATAKKMHWILDKLQGFDMFIDHNILIYMSDTISVHPDLSVGFVKKVLRWGFMMCMYSYVCVHIKGETNVWADLLGRLSALKTIRRIVPIPALPSPSRAD